MVGIEVVAKVPSLGGESLKGAEHDWKFRAVVLFSLEALDAPDDMVDGIRLASIERQALVNMEGTNGEDVEFNYFGLKGSVAKGCNPFQQEPS
jgi:hypothetical protein